MNILLLNAGSSSLKATLMESADGSVRVRDCGPGIAEAERELIFQRFWRADRQRSDGAGLGLSIVRGVAEDHAATVAVENLRGGGAQFTLCDGSVRYISQNINHQMFQYLGGRNDGQVIGNY